MIEDIPVQDIFNAARRLSDAAERAAYLDRACRGDAATRAEVEALLEADAEGDSFLESPAVEMAPAVTPLPEPIGSMVGPYKLLETIGEGGFGMVYMAEQERPVRRRVALKVIKPGLDTREVIARFEAERQALALMDHQHIAKVFDAGATESGRPFFVMELVRGVPITEFCDRNRLPPHERLRLFVQVCRAVQHAHAKGIIHRDIKPTNVLVTLNDGVPVPKVIDFGVAKATGARLTERTLFTRFAQMVGTPLYMSPEQTDMTSVDVDTRSDVYSLGVLLYELLTGTTPMDKERLKEAAFDEVRRIIREEEPPRPSTRISTMSEQARSVTAAQRRSDPRRLGHLVRGELDWIVMKALEKDRNRRYETANGFALDVERYLADEPVLACPPSAGYRVRKFVRRHKGLVAAATVVSLTLAAGIVGTSVGLVRAERARSAESARAEGERRAKELAESNLTLATEAVEKYLGAVTVDPALARSDLSQLRRRLLEGALPFLQRIAERKGDDPFVAFGRGRGHILLADVRLELGEFETARKDVEAGIAIIASLPAAALPDDTRLRYTLARGHLTLGSSLRFLGNHEEAVEAWQRAIAGFEGLPGLTPQGPGFSPSLAEGLEGLGDTLGNLERFEDSLAAYLRELEIRTQLVAAFPKEWAYRSAVAQCRASLSFVRGRLGKYEEAEADLREALRLREQVVAESPGIPQSRRDLAVSRLQLAQLLAPRQREAAEALYRGAVGDLRRLSDEVPSVPDFRDVLSRGLSQLGSFILVSWGTGRLPDAEAALRDAVGVHRGLVDDVPRVPEYRGRLARSLHDLGNALFEQQKVTEAEAAHREAQAIQEALAADFPKVPLYGVDVLSGYGTLGYMYLRTGHPEAALPWYERSIAGLEPMLAREAVYAGVRLYLRNAHWGRAESLTALGRREDALPSLLRVVELNRIILGPDDPDTLGAMHNVARCHRDLGHREEALRLQAETFALMKAKIPDHGYTLIAMGNLAILLMEAGRGEEAVPLGDEYVRRAAGDAFHSPSIMLVMCGRLQHFRRKADASGCRETAEIWEGLHRTEADDLYHIAWAHAVTAAVLSASAGGAGAAESASAEAGRAVEWLGKAIAAGYDVALFEKDADLDVLRDREDFKQLLATATRDD